MINILAEFINNNGRLGGVVGAIIVVGVIFIVYIVLHALLWLHLNPRKRKGYSVTCSYCGSKGLIEDIEDIDEARDMFAAFGWRVNSGNLICDKCFKKERG